MIKIGCQDHSIAFWSNVSEGTLEKMDPRAKEFWGKNGTMILATAKSVQQKN